MKSNYLGGKINTTLNKGQMPGTINNKNSHPSYLLMNKFKKEYSYHPNKKKINDLIELFFLDSSSWFMKYGHELPLGKHHIDWMIEDGLNYWYHELMIKSIQ